MLCYMSLCMLWFNPTRRCFRTCLDSQHARLCLPISPPGDLITCIFSLIGEIWAKGWSFLSPIVSFLQFIREYSGKVDELIKDKLEAQKEVKAKEQEDKDVMSQQVKLTQLQKGHHCESSFFFDKINWKLLFCFFVFEITCTLNCCHLLYPHHRCQEWEVVAVGMVHHHQWAEECLQCHHMECHQWVATNWKVNQKPIGRVRLVHIALARIWLR